MRIYSMGEEEFENLLIEPFLDAHDVTRTPTVARRFVYYIRGLFDEHLDGTVLTEPNGKMEK